jgi:hypothetical protein
VSLALGVGAVWASSGAVASSNAGSKSFLLKEKRNWDYQP